MRPALVVVRLRFAGLTVIRPGDGGVVPFVPRATTARISRLVTAHSRQGPHMRVIIRTLAATTGLALALSLAACGSSTDASVGEPAAPVASTPRETPRTATSSTAALNVDNFYEVLAAAPQDSTSYRLTMATWAGDGETITRGEVAIADDGSAAMSLTMTEQGVDSLAVVVDNIFYMEMGELTDGKFLKVDLNDPSNPFDEFFGSIKDLMDPSSTVKTFKDSVRSVQAVGADEIGGASTTHYLVTVDTSGLRDALAGADPSLTASMPDVFVYDFWVDGDNRPVKLTSTTMGTRAEAVYSDWNDPSIVVEAPSADQISPLTWQEIMQGGPALQG